MEINDTLKNKLLQMAGTSGYERGKQLFEEDAVLDLIRDARGFNTRVANNIGRFEQIRIVLKRNYFSSKCTCSTTHSAICEHAVAAFFKFYNDFPDELLSIVMSEQSIKNIPGAFINENTISNDEIKLAQEKQPHAYQNAILQQISLKSLLEQLEQVKGHITIYYEGSGFPSAESRWVRNKFTVELHFDDKIYSGSNIKTLVETGSAAASMNFTDFSPQDQYIMRFFASKGELLGSNFILEASNMGILFHSLIDFDRFYSRTQRINIHKQVASLAFEIQAVSETEIIIVPKLKVETFGLISTRGISVISTASGYWLGIKGDYWWLPILSGPNWLYSFLNGEPTKLTTEKYSLIKDYIASRKFPIELISSTEQSYTTVKTAKCTPVLTLDWHKKSLSSKLEFSYEGSKTSMNGPEMVWTGLKYIIRNTDDEEKALKKMKRMGFTIAKDEPGVFRMLSLEKAGAFIDSSLPKLTKTWEIYYSNEFNIKKRSSGPLKVAISTVSENMAWFEISYKFATQSGSATDWVSIIKAIENNKNYVRLDSGGLSKISPELKKLIENSLAHSVGEPASGNLKFSHFNSVYMGNLLSECEQETENQWFRNKDVIVTNPKDIKINLPAKLQKTLRDYQKDGVLWMKMLQKNAFHGVLADEMGLGKTLQTLSLLLDFKRNSKEKYTSLIVCPSSLVENWHAEAIKFTPTLKTIPIHGYNRLEKIANLKDYDLAITSYALIRRDIAAYDEHELKYLVLDEAQHIKNADTANAKTCKLIKADHRLILTGTPIENSVKEVWSLFDFLLPGLLGTPKVFQERFERKINTSEAKEATEELASCIRPFMLRRKKREVCSQLPEKIEQIIYCELNSEQRSLYQAMMLEAKEMLNKIREGSIQKHRFEILSVLLKLRQICCHPMLLPERYHEDVKGIISAKHELVKELIFESMDSGHRILLFSQFTSYLKIIKSWLIEANIPFEYLDGSTKNRMKKVNNFNDNDNIPIFLLSLKAGGTGLNLTGASTVIHYDQWWNPMVEDQATDRTHRIGQEKQVTSMKLIMRNTVEEKVLKLQDKKRDLFNQLMNGVPSKLGELTRDDFNFLLSE